MARPKTESEITDEMMGKNPLMNNVTFPVRRRKKSDIENGDTQYDLFESVHYVKVYDCAGYRREMKELSIRAKEMYLYVIHYAPQSRDWMFIDAASYMDDMKIKSKHTFLDAIKELHEKRYISLHPFIKYAFFINPKLLYKGSRINKYPDNLDIKKWTNKKDNEENI